MKILMNETVKPKIKIVEPVTKNDFIDSLHLVEKNIIRDKGWGLDYYMHRSSGEIFVARLGNKIVGTLVQRRPGGIFDELPDQYFDLENIKADKQQIGFIVLVAIDPKYQGQGIGGKLLSKALSLQKEWKSKCVGVHCWQSSPGNASERLFRKFGFEPLKMHKAPWLEYSIKLSLKDFECPVCGCPCKCDELEMVFYL